MGGMERVSMMLGVHARPGERERGTIGGGGESGAGWGRRERERLMGEFSRTRVRTHLGYCIKTCRLHEALGAWRCAPACQGCKGGEDVEEPRGRAGWVGCERSSGHGPFPAKKVGCAGQK